jgi:hypothetical protein
VNHVLVVARERKLVGREQRKAIKKFFWLFTTLALALQLILFSTIPSLPSFHASIDVYVSLQKSFFLFPSSRAEASDRS